MQSKDCLVKVSESKGVGCSEWWMSAGPRCPALYPGGRVVEKHPFLLLLAGEAVFPAGPVLKPEHE